jgi:ABC-2 type transport system ATP-binding protein
MAAAISISGLVKSFGATRALDGLDLTVETGEVHGFLGPNGSGKTTTIRVLLGFLRATAGRASVLGCDCWRDSHRIKRDVGYLPGDLRLYPWLTARTGLDLARSVRGRSDRDSGPELLARFELDPDVPVRKMSRGTRQKLGLVLALAHGPRLIVLDEPSAGLDPLMRDQLARVLRERAAAGATVFFSSHTLGEVQALCERIAIVRDGRIVADEMLSSLRGRATREVTIRFHDDAAALLAVPPPSLRVHERSGPLWRAELAGEPGPLLEFLRAVRPADFTLGPPDLEGIFRSYYRREEEDAP